MDFKIIAEVKPDQGHTLCLEYDKKDEAYRLVWYGTKKSKNGFIPRPAHFTMGQLTDLLKKAQAKGKLKISVKITGE